ncbi:MAG: hypothetical protein KVP17_002527 [Porospora cf. gigantea B]|uniref:uncharacterized protein n=1 Tax=Porospora cf. gigantea B TaxID=2853592 RepID=UPI003571D94B|nr:MAG: hypothetical protein KVP17_002527 [Porospora cf. gigantea B]
MPSAVTCDNHMQLLLLQQSTAGWSEVLDATDAIFQLVASDLRLRHSRLDCAFSTFGSRTTNFVEYACYQCDSPFSDILPDSAWNGVIFSDEDVQLSPWAALIRAVVDPKVGWSPNTSDIWGRPVTKVIVTFTSAFPILEEPSTQVSVVNGKGCTPYRGDLNLHHNDAALLRKFVLVLVVMPREPKTLDEIYSLAKQCEVEFPEGYLASQVSVTEEAKNRLHDCYSRQYRQQEKAFEDADLPFFLKIEPYGSQFPGRVAHLTSTLVSLAIDSLVCVDVAPKDATAHHRHLMTLMGVLSAITLCAVLAKVASLCVRSFERDTQPQVTPVIVSQSFSASKWSEL